MTAVRVSPCWLALREPADAAARASDLVEELRRDLPAGRPLVVHDLGCGTGSMLRWLAPRLAGPQHWICHDVDAGLLAVAAGEQQCAADGAPVSVEVRQQDATRLPSSECADAALITTSALLDLLTDDELRRLTTAWAQAQCPVLLTLSVTGEVELWPPHPLDAPVGAAFNAHQRRVARGRQLLGPDAVDVLIDAFRGSGHDVLVRASPWRLGAAAQTLTTAWFTGWLAAACEQQPELAARARGYARQRLADAAAGRLRVFVHHRDVLVLPRGRGQGPPVNVSPAARVLIGEQRTAATQRTVASR